jgi:hypothetical protein
MVKLLSNPGLLCRAAPHSVLQLLAR